MSDNRDPMPWVYVCVNRAGDFVGVPCQTSRAAWCWLMIDRRAESVEQLQEWGYTVHKYVKEEPCQTKPC